MKNVTLILTISLLFFSLKSMAQRKLQQLDEEQANQKKQYESMTSVGKFDREKFVFGGNFTGGFSSYSSFLMVQPLAGYFVAKNTIAGIGATYIYYGANKNSTSAYGPSVFVRQIFADRFFAHAEMQGINYTDYNRFSVSSQDYQRRWANHIFVGGGVGGKKGGYFAVLYNVLYDPYNSFMLWRGNPIDIRVGFLF